MSISHPIRKFISIYVSYLIDTTLFLMVGLRLSFVIVGFTIERNLFWFWGVWSVHACRHLGGNYLKVLVSLGLGTLSGPCLLVVKFRLPSPVTSSPL